MVWAIIVIAFWWALLACLAAWAFGPFCGFNDRSPRQ